MKVYRRIAMPGNEQEALAIGHRILGRQREFAMLVGWRNIADCVTAMDPRRPGVEGERFQARVDDRLVRPRLAHHRGEDEKTVLEALVEGTLEVEIEAIVDIHEDVRAGL